MADEEFGGKCADCQTGYVVGGKCLVCGASPRREPATAEEQEEADETQRLMTTLSRLLTRTAVGLKGEPPELVSWSWHDLPAIAERLREFAEAQADEGCAYGDDCTAESMRQRRHGQCLPCKARAALFQRAP